MGGSVRLVLPRRGSVQYLDGGGGGSIIAAFLTRYVHRWGSYTQVRLSARAWRCPAQPGLMLFVPPAGNTSIVGLNSKRRSYT